MPLEVVDREVLCLLMYVAGTEASKLTGKMPLPLLCIGNRFLFEHQLEWLSDEGFKDIRLSLADRPREVEAVVGAGARWGVQVSYATDPEGAELGARLKKHLGQVRGGMLLVDGNALLRFPFSERLTDSTAFESASGPLPVLFMRHDDWRRLLHHRCPSSMTGLCRLARELMPRLPTVRVAAFYQPISDIASFREINRAIQDRGEGFQFKGFERTPDVRVGRMTHISSGAAMRGPCLIGDGVLIRSGAVVGPGAFIGDRSLIESGAHIEDSVVAPGTYIGRNTSFEGQYVCRDYVLDLERETAIHVDDPLILGDLTRPLAWGRGLARLTAWLLLIVCLPLTLALLPIHRLLRGEWLVSQWMLVQPVRTNLRGELDYQWRRWHRFDFGWFALDLLPCLWAIVRGELAFVGNPPLGREAVAAIEEVWEEELLRGKVGITGPVQQLDPKISTADDIFATSIYYNATRTLKEDALLFLNALVPGMHRFKRSSH